MATRDDYFQRHSTRTTEDRIEAARPAPQRRPADPVRPLRPAEPVRAPRAPRRSRSLRSMLHAHSELRRAIILREVIGPPIALRRPDQDDALV